MSEKICSEPCSHRWCIDAKNPNRKADILETIKTILAVTAVAGGCIALIAIVCLGCQFVDVRLNQIPVTVIVDGNEVYSGPNACVDIQSGGATTTVTVNGGFLCIIPKAKYTSHDVHVMGDRR